MQQFSLVRWATGGWSFVAALFILTWLAGGGSAGALSSARQQDDPAAQATATREAELAEIADLRATVSALQTQVALAYATPEPTIEPTPVPPLPAGQAVPLGTDWSVTVVEAGSRPTIGEHEAKGMFVEVRLEVNNLTSTPQTFPFRDFQLRDSDDRIYLVDQVATTSASPRVHLSVDPTVPQELLLIFDVLPDAGAVFILESTVDPTFRVETALAQRG